MRVAVLGMRHETNTFAVERNDTLDVPTQMGEEVLAEAHPKSYIGGFAEAAEAADVELVPVGNVNFVAGGRGGIITAEVYTHYRDLFLDGLREAGPLDGVYFALHGAMAVEEPYMEAEADLLRSARELLGNETPFVATYDFHSNYAEGECDLAVPVPLNSNPHIDAYERGMEAADLLLRMQAGDIAPVTRFVRVPILGPNVGQSTWSHLPNDEMRLPLYHLNLLREDWEKKPGVLNLTIQGGYGYSDIPYAGMSVIATTDGDPVLAEQLARDMAQELWDRREEIRTVRPILPIERGIEIAMRRDEGLVCLVDLGDDPGSLCPADSPAVLEALLRLGARDCALTIRDENVVEAGLEAGVGATLKMEVGASVDQRFYQPLPVTGYVKAIDDGNYTITGPAHGGWGKVVTREAFREVDAGPRVVLRVGNKIDVIFSRGRTGKDRDFFKSAGIVFEEKRIVVTKSNQGHRASFDPIVAANINLDTPGVAMVDYESLPFEHLPRPIYPLDLDMEWKA